MNREQEVKQCFKENPDLYHKTLDQVAMFFLLQGEISSAYTREAAIRQARYFRNELWKLDADLVAKLDEKWKEEMAIK